jgi:hypothetical protein
VYKVVTAEEANSDPVDLATLGQWAAEGRIGHDTLLLDVESGRQFRAGDHPFLASRLPRLADVALPPFFDSRSAVIRNTSGQNGDVPPEISGWSWGAFGMGVFGLGWLWGINQRLTKMFLLLFPFFLLHVYLIVATVLKMPGHDIAKPTTYVLNSCYYWVAGYLGRNGNGLAWRHRRFVDVDDFKACQRVWGWWALAMTIGALALLAAIIIFFTMLDSVHRVSS